MPASPVKEESGRVKDESGQDRTDLSSIPPKQQAPLPLTPAGIPQEAETASSPGSQLPPTMAQTPPGADTSGQEPIKTEPAATAAIPEPPEESTGTAATSGPDNAAEEPNGLQNTIQQAGSTSFTLLRQIIDGNCLEQLEPGVKTALSILEELKAPLGDIKVGVEENNWLKRIAKLQAQAKKSRVVAGVVGNTGAGKSSCINAILGEDRFLPTNGVRACTAVITEISWNDSNNPEELYRVEVEFVSRDDWGSELAALWGDLVGEDRDLDRNYLDADTEAGVAYAKLKAVYPGKTRTKEMLLNCSPKEFLEEAEVRDVLGSTKKVTARDAKTVYRELQKYLDSNERVKKNSKEKKQMVFWPLIRVVRVYCKAKVLSTGLVLVDLPGVQDANAARSAVASRYMVECSALWVVAPITRAVDDKVAKNLLGNSFRRQLKMDGTYSNVTFICTKTDDISVQESLDTFDDDAIRANIAKEDETEKHLQEKVTSLESLRLRESELDTTLDKLQDTHREWKFLLRSLEAGKPAYHPASRKRKRDAQEKSSSRARRVLNDSDSDEGEQDDTSNPLTREDIKAKIAEIEEQFSRTGAEFEQVSQEIRATEDTIEKLREEKNRIVNERSALCIQMRNDYSQRNIKLDFAAGIREIDEDDAAAAEGARFDPPRSQRNYDEVARSLPVFCISSWAFQRLCGHQQMDSPLVGFRDINETGVPQLQEHAIQLTESVRILNSKSFLNDFEGLLNSLVLWAASDNSILNVDIEMGDYEQSYEIKHLDMSLEKLRMQFEAISKKLASDILDAIDQGFIQPSVNAAALGSSKIPTIVAEWGKKRTEGGVHWVTYKAICRRRGAKTKGATARDFNEEILTPYQQGIATAWEDLFRRQLPHILEEIPRECQKLLTDFHKTMAERPELKRCKAVPLTILEQQLRSHTQAVKDLVYTFKIEVQAQRREASRLFLPFIRETMLDAYDTCAAMTGRGSFTEMKETMAEHAEEVRSSIYRHAVTNVKDELTEAGQKLGVDAKDKTKQITETMSKDYKSVILGSSIIEASEMARDHLRKLLPSIDEKFNYTIESMDLDVTTEPMDLDVGDGAPLEQTQIPESG